MKILGLKGEFDYATIKCVDAKIERTLTWNSSYHEVFVLDNRLRLLEAGFTEKVIADKCNRLYTIVFTKNGYDVKFYINVYAK